MAKIKIITHIVDTQDNPVLDVDGFIQNETDRSKHFYEGRPTVTLSDNVEYEYQPYGIGAPQLLGNSLGHERQSESDENWLETNAPSVLLADAKSKKTKQWQVEAGAKIALLFGQADAEKLKLKQLNALARMGSLLRKEAKGVATADEVTELDILQDLDDVKNAIRNDENVATLDIKALTTIEDVEAYKIVWSS